MKVLITGATGFVGRRLVQSFKSVKVLSRNPDKAKSSLSDLAEVEAFAWDAKSPPPKEAFEGVEAVFHLAGEPVAEGRWSQAKKDRIYNSRADGTKLLVDGMKDLESKPKVLVSASAVGFYGDRGDELLHEDAKPADDFLARVCKAWEESAATAKDHGIRTCSLRIGIVIGQGGGAMSKMLLPFKLGLGGRLGSGKQYMPWIHVDDVVGLARFCAENESCEGIFNATAPKPLSNYDFTKTLGRVLGRPTIFPAPAFMLKLALGEFAQVLLGSQNAVPKAALDKGYKFHYSELEKALRSAVYGEHAETAKQLVNAS